MSYHFCGGCGDRLADRVQLTEKICSKCGSSNPPDYGFCGGCGGKLDTVCPNCGASVPPDSRYCPKCAFLCAEGRHEI